MDLRTTLFDGGRVVISQDQEGPFAIQFVLPCGRLGRQQSQGLSQIVAQAVRSGMDMSKIVDMSSKHDETPLWSSEAHLTPSLSRTPTVPPSEAAVLGATSWRQPFILHLGAPTSGY